MAVAALFTVLGRILLFLAAAQLPPLVLALAEADAATARGFAVGIVCAVFVGVVLVLIGQGEAGRLGRREAPLLAVAGWTLAAVFAAIPLSLSDAVPDLPGSLLEAMSGVTATGLSVIPSIDDAPRGIVLWRALLQWSGGLATIVFVATLVPRIAEAAPLDPARSRFGRVAVERDTDLRGADPGYGGRSRIHGRVPVRGRVLCDEQHFDGRFRRRRRRADGARTRRPGDPRAGDGGGRRQRPGGVAHGKRAHRQLCRQRRGVVVRSPRDRRGRHRRGGYRRRERRAHGRGRVASAVRSGVLADDHGFRCRPDAADADVS